ncbi:MAG TPA: hypothetical protein VEB86_03795, partial [Chryseosolibacter sp.]|nr:hypothetical protein [Chryseosolibacter sp.]
MTKLLAFGLAIILSGSIVGKAQVLINEICPANADVLYDLQYYNFSPWVELYNAGSSPVNVGGYFLSDDDAAKTKWQIPA